VNLESVINGWINVGFVWLGAMIFNPDVDSGTVWLVAVAVWALTYDIYNRT
jgi:hypothetical protein